MSRARFGARGVQFSGRGLNPPAMLVLVAPAPTDRAAPSRAHIPLEFSSALSLPCIWRWRALFRELCPDDGGQAQRAPRRGRSAHVVQREPRGRERAVSPFTGLGWGAGDRAAFHSRSNILLRGGATQSAATALLGSRTLCARTAHARTTQPSAPN